MRVEDIATGNTVRIPRKMKKTLKRFRCVPNGYDSARKEISLEPFSLWYPAFVFRMSFYSRRNW